MTRKEELEIILADLINSLSQTMQWMSQEFNGSLSDRDFERRYERYKSKQATFEKYLKEYNQLNSFFKG